MIKVYDRLYVGNLTDCGTLGMSTVHACKAPCHQDAVGYKGSLVNTHPYYLALQKGDNLFLNMIDPPVPLFQIESFRVFKRFAAEQYSKDASLLIHCNQGESRAPSLALVFLACCLQVIPSDTFYDAYEDFLHNYGAYNPGKGIRKFLEDNWDQLKEGVENELRNRKV